MKLYMKQKVFSLVDKYTFFDDMQNPVLKATGKFFEFLPKYHLNDAITGAEMYYIKHVLTVFMGRFEIYSNNTLCAIVQQQFAFFHPKLEIQSQYASYTIEGDYFAHDFTLFKNGQYFGSVHKKYLSWGDNYEIDIADPTDASFVCALVISIDSLMHNGRQ